MPSVRATSVGDLRKELLGGIRTQQVRWVRLDGLSLDDPQKHRALSRILAEIGVAGVDNPTLPEAVVLDWSNVVDCGAEALAFFSVLVLNLLELGVQVIVCGASVGDVSALVDQACGEFAPGSITSIASPVSGLSRVVSAAPTTALHNGRGAAMSTFCDCVSTTLSQLRAKESIRITVIGTMQEALLNALEHSGATYVVASAFLFHRRRPKVIQIGVADNGRGIAASLLANPRFEWLSSLNDASITEHMLDVAGSSRSQEEGRPEPKGGMGQAIKRLLIRTRSVVMVRSGAALITLESKQPDRYTRTLLDYGLGTQVRLEIECEC